MNRMTINNIYKIVQQTVGQFYPTAIVGTVSAQFSNPSQTEEPGYGE